MATHKLLLGNVGGCIGETSSLAILIGGVILVATRVAHWRIMAAMVLGGLVLGGAFHLAGIGPSLLFHRAVGRLPVRRRVHGDGLRSAAPPRPPGCGSSVAASRS
ncbi:MAG: RnfABCDGE type electron transport complex subunit D [Candidatus Krumholzibacteriia bacterium]